MFVQESVKKKTDECREGCCSGTTIDTPDSLTFIEFPNASEKLSVFARAHLHPDIHLVDGKDQEPIDPADEGSP